MVIAVLCAVFIWPAIAIAGLIALFKTIRNAIKGDNPNEDYTQNKYNIHYETPEEEARRTAEYGYDDPRWGKL